MERYRIIYSWKTLNGLAPDIGLVWNSGSESGRSGRTLEVSKVTGITEGLKTRRRETIQHEGVRLLNVLPCEIRNFSGKLEIFKCLLDSYLSIVPDEPETEDLKSNIVDCEGVTTNSLYYWCLKTHVNWKPCVKLIRDSDFRYVLKPDMTSQGEAQLNLS